VRFSPRKRTAKAQRPLATSAQVEARYAPCLQALGSPTFAALQASVQAAGAVLMTARSRTAVALAVASACYSVAFTGYSDLLVRLAVAPLPSHARHTVADTLRAQLRQPASPRLWCVRTQVRWR